MPNPRVSRSTVCRFNYDVMCEDILEYMQDNSISKPIVLGHSLGGKVGMKIAFSFPNKIDKLIVVDIAPREYNTDFIQDFLQNELLGHSLAD